MMVQAYGGPAPYDPQPLPFQPPPQQDVRAFLGLPTTRRLRVAVSREGAVLRLRASLDGRLVSELVLPLEGDGTFTLESDI
jgi:hypothetical protein